MPSGLMRKLNAMKSGSTEKPRAPERPLIRRVYRCAVSEALYSIPNEALRRIGYTGGAFDIERALFLDTETTGLSGGAGTVAFLVGVGHIENGLLTVEQFLMPTYAQESEMLACVSKAFEEKDTVIHFNGKSFDMPLLASRFTMNRMRESFPDVAQLDLLYPSRRLWKLRLGSCRLSELEEKVLDVRREGDLPGAEVPARYFEFLKTGDMALIEDILDHNRQDIVTLQKLLLRLVQAFYAPEEETEALDRFSLGKAFERMGEWEEARKMYKAAAAPRTVVNVKGLVAFRYAGEANKRLYRIYKRNGEYEKAEETLKCMIARRQLGDYPRLELCKLYEHKMGRLREALALVQQLMQSAETEDMAGLVRRRDRIHQKIEKQQRTEGEKYGIL